MKLVGQPSGANGGRQCIRASCALSGYPRDGCRQGLRKNCGQHRRYRKTPEGVRKRDSTSLFNILRGPRIQSELGSVRPTPLSDWIQVL